MSLKLNSPTAIAKLSVIGAATMNCIRTKKTSNRMKTQIRTLSGRRIKGTIDTIDRPRWKSATTTNTIRKESVTTCSQELTKNVNSTSTGKIRVRSMAADKTRKSSSRLRRRSLKSLRRPT